MKNKRSLDGILIREKHRKISQDSKINSTVSQQEDFYSQEFFYPQNLCEKEKQKRFFWKKLILVPVSLILLATIFYFNKGYALNKLNKSSNSVQKQENLAENKKINNSFKQVKAKNKLITSKNQSSENQISTIQDSKENNNQKNQNTNTSNGNNQNKTVENSDGGGLKIASLTPVKETSSELLSVTASGNTIYTCGKGIILKSTDGGHTWSDNLVNNFPSGAPTQIKFNDIYTVDGNIVWACGQLIGNPETGHSGYYWFVSENGGTSWNLGELPDGQEYTDLPFSIVAKDNRNVWIGGGNKIIYSSDGGANWNKQADTNSIVIVLELAGENTIYAGLHDATMRKTTNGGANWTTINNIEHMLHIQDASALDENKVWICGEYKNKFSDPAIQYTNDGGNTWKNFSVGSNFFYGIAAYDINNIFAVYGGAMGAVYTHNGGESWANDIYSGSGGLNDIEALDNQLAIAVGHLTNGGGIIFLIDASKPPTPGPTPGPTPSPSRPSSSQLVRTGTNYLYLLISLIISLIIVFFVSLRNYALNQKKKNRIEIK